ncbi:hypothetical protein EON71_00090 [bacterium]|nr:MAG: hypothetical protein EON71_00090 [bacterium]
MYRTQHTPLDRFLAMPNKNIGKDYNYMQDISRGISSSITEHDSTIEKSARYASRNTNDFTTTTVHLAPFLNESHIDIKEKQILFSCLKKQEIHCKNTTLLNICMLNYFLELKQVSLEKYNPASHPHKKQKIEMELLQKKFIEELKEWEGVCCADPSDFGDMFAFFGVMRTMDSQKYTNVVSQYNFYPEYICEKTGTVITSGTSITRDIWDAQAGDRLYLIVKYIENPYNVFYGPTGKVISEKQTIGDIMQIVPVKNHILMEDVGCDSNSYTSSLYTRTKIFHPCALVKEGSEWVVKGSVNVQNNDVPANVSKLKAGVKENVVCTSHIIYVGRAGIVYDKPYSLPQSTLQKALRCPEILETLPMIEVHLDR